MSSLDRKSLTLTIGTILLTVSLAFAAVPDRPQRALRGSQEMQVRIEAIPAPAPRDLRSALRSWRRDFSRLSRTEKPQPAPRPPRSMDLAEDRWLIEAYDTQGSKRYWQVIPDPRVLRAEFPPPGQTTGEVESALIYAEAADFLVTLPNDPSIVELKVFQPRWNGQDYELDVLGTLSLR